jgi:SWI/SNF-related matrix-associated actin-dependent regulator of chromatin subfamily A member 5
LEPEEQAEKEKLLNQAFGHWNKPQFFLFIKLLARYGR